MDGKGVKKLTNRVEKFDAFDHFSAGLDGICLGITGVNDAFIHSTFLSFAAGKNFDLSIILDRTQSCPVLVTRED